MRTAAPATDRSRRLLIVVAVLHAAAPLLLLGVHLFFGFDETVYLSQLNGHVAAGVFSAPRARGATLLAAPVTLITTSVAAVRLWLAVLSGCGLYVAFRPWLRLRPGCAVPLAALLFCSVWVTIYYGFEVMPNEWVAFAAVAACGHLLIYLNAGGRRHLVAVFVAVALIALLRPSDAIFAVVALGLATAALRGLQRRARLLALVAMSTGLVAGSAEWVIEAYVRFGGVGRRIRLAQAEQGGGGLHFAGAAQARTLAGPILCRNGCHADAPILFRLWWSALVLLVLAALWFARRAGAPGLDAVPTVVGLAMAAQYVFTVTYSAPRFLLPAYALLALPAAVGAVRLVTAARSAGARRIAAGTATLLLAAHLAVQVDVVVRRVGPSAHRGQRLVLAQSRFLHAEGLRQPCAVIPDEHLAYAAGCTNAPDTPARVLSDLRRGIRVCWIRTGPPSRRYDTTWDRMRLPGQVKGQTQMAYLSAATGRGR